MNGPARAHRVEPRWPVALAILGSLFLLQLLPGRVRPYPIWVPYAVVAAWLVPMVLLALTPARRFWRRVEHVDMLICSAVAGVLNLVALMRLVLTMVRRSGEIGGLQLLSSSIVVWITNVLVFTLIYWQIDRGGPGAREDGAGRRPDWLFPQAGSGDDAPPGWRPTFVDYLFLGYSTATAFSPTDALPLTSRAKMLMMLESTISLVTIVVVGSRAINILGS